MPYIRFFLLVAAAARVATTCPTACDSSPTATITSAPWSNSSDDASGVGRRGPDEPDAISLAQILLTAVPESLKQIAATNVPAASSILWSEFLDGSRPAWFVALPTDIQSYLVRQFGPQTASAEPTPSFPWFSSAPASSPSETPIPASSASESAVPTASLSTPSTLPVSSLSSAPTNPPTSPSTSRPSATKFVTSVVTISASNAATSTGKPTRSPAASDPPAPEAHDSGMSRSTKIGLGVGIPISILGAAAIVLGCCFLVRRRKRLARAPVRPSPDFIPESAFHQKSSPWDKHPLVWDGGYFGALSGDTLEYGDSSSEDKVGSSDEEPKISPPLLLHTHTSKRGRGKRTSYTSLQSVPEDPEDNNPSNGKGKGKMPAVPPKASNPRSPVSPISPTGSFSGISRPKIKRKPVGGRAYDQRQRSEEEILRESTENLLYPGKKNRVDSGYSFSRNSNPFTDGHGYLEDYGPEYSRGYDGLGGSSHVRRHSFDRPGYSKTQFPFRGERRSFQRNKSPLWDRLDEEE